MRAKESPSKNKTRNRPTEKNKGVTHFPEFNANQTDKIAYT